MTRISIPPDLRRLVWSRAGDRCEYCLLHDRDTAGPLVIDHIIAVKHRGPTEAENLALACMACNLYKGSDIATIDPTSGRLVPLFDPRRQVWSEHFEFDGATIVGLTPVGRGTVTMLQINEPSRLVIRAELLQKGRYLDPD